MLNFNLSVQRSTQGEPPAEMTLANTPPANDTAPSPSLSAEQPVTASAPHPPPALEPRAIAERVYQLMRQDVAVLNERRGRRS